MRVAGARDAVGPRVEPRRPGRLVAQLARPASVTAAMMRSVARAASAGRAAAAGVRSDRSTGGADRDLHRRRGRAGAARLPYGASRSCGPHAAIGQHRAPGLQRDAGGAGLAGHRPQVRVAGQRALGVDDDALAARARRRPRRGRRRRPPGTRGRPGSAWPRAAPAGRRRRRTATPWPGTAAAGRCRTGSARRPAGRRARCGWARRRRRRSAGRFSVPRPVAPGDRDQHRAEHEGGEGGTRAPACERATRRGPPVVRRRPSAAERRPPSPTADAAVSRPAVDDPSMRPRPGQDGRRGRLDGPGAGEAAGGRQDPAGRGSPVRARADLALAFAVDTVSRRWPPRGVPRSLVVTDDARVAAEVGAAGAARRRRRSASRAQPGAGARRRRGAGAVARAGRRAVGGPAGAAAGRARGRPARRRPSMPRCLRRRRRGHRHHAADGRRRGCGWSPRFGHRSRGPARGVRRRGAGRAAGVAAPRRGHRGRPVRRRAAGGRAAHRRAVAGPPAGGG